MRENPLHTYRQPLRLASFITFAISLAFYWITADPGASYWDCPEYVVSASKLEVGHPPGNPLWMLMMRVATIPFSAEYHAYVINLCSGLFMAFAAFFLSRCIFVGARLYFHSKSQDKISSGSWDIIASFVAIGGTLCFALCDSAWFSAVEAEVYAMSTFLAALSIWLMIVWWWEDNRAKAYRLIILLAYISGISLGVHQLNLLLLPVFTIIVIYKRFPHRVSLVIVILAILGSTFLIALILMAIIPALFYGAESFELFGANILGLPYETGTIAFVALIFLLIIIGISLSQYFVRLDVFQVQTVFWMCAFLLLGLSSFGMIMIRAKASPPMNEGTPDNIFALSSYFQRDQYPSSPLLYGETPYSRPLFEESFFSGKPRYSKYVLKKEKPIYQKVNEGAAMNYRSGMLDHEDSVENRTVMEKKNGYVISDYKFSQVLTPELNMWFPRITSRNVNDREAYEGWAGMTEETMEKIPISETIDSGGNLQPRLNPSGEREPVYSFRPTYLQHLRYFVAYQSYYMYFRYLFWNFIGRQNDLPSMGEIDHGNFITGMPLVDHALVGNVTTMPDEIWEENKGRNRYFGIPFIIGVIGIISLSVRNRSSRRILTVVSLLFLMTGLAIVVYLNQSPGEPRERDYTFLGSYLAFSMFIAAGLAALASGIIKLLPRKLAIVLSCVISIGPATLMAIENFDDHDRSNRYETTFYAGSILEFETPAIIFSHGDNSTFPLWYASEVLEMGKMHTPVDVTYLSLPSYVVNLKKQGEKGVETIAPTPEIAYGKYLLTRLPADSLSSPMPLEQALQVLYSSSKDSPVFPTSKVILPANEGDSIVLNLRELTNGSSYMSFKHLMLLDLIASQLISPAPKVLYFPSVVDNSFHKALNPVFRPVVFGKIYAPWLTDSVTFRLLQTGVEREIKRLNQQNHKLHYSEPVVADRSVRYRGELIIAAEELLEGGDSILPFKIVEVIDKHYPYSVLLPGNFTMTDTTFFEGHAYIGLLDKLAEIAGDTTLSNKSRNLKKSMENRRAEWIKYYQSLTPEERKTISNKSKRLLIK